MSLRDLASHGASLPSFARARVAITDGNCAHAGRRSARRHRPGTHRRRGRTFWKLVTLTGMDRGNDIHVELLGAHGRVLARITSTNDAPATVTVHDGRAHLSPRASVENHAAQGEAPRWVHGRRRRRSGARLSGLLGPNLPGRFSMVPVRSSQNCCRRTRTDAVAPVVGLDRPKWALSVAAYASGEHLGMAGAQRYTAVAHGEPCGSNAVVRALLPLIAGLGY